MAFDVDEIGHDNSIEFMQVLKDEHSDSKLIEKWIALGKAILAAANDKLQNAGHINTGELIGSGKIFEVGAGHIVIGYSAQQAVWIEFGRGIVRPVHKQKLRWIDKHTNKPVFADESAATEPFPFLSTSVLEETEKYSDLVAKEFIRMIEEAARGRGSSHFRPVASKRTRQYF